MKQKQHISAEIICDSKSEAGNRITTFILIFPRIVLAEFNTHRMLTRNSASSRAIPFKKMLQRVMSDPFIPIGWMKDHSGMQGNEYFEGFKVWLLTQLWLTARNFAVIFAWLLSKLGLTKQIVNRLLEPFMWHTCLATGTEWENFFALRADGPAEIHIQDLAFKMLQELNKSKPKLLKEDQWHIPFGDKIDTAKLLNELISDMDDMIMTKVKIATARCARTSYLNFEGKDDYRADLKLHDSLSKSGHWSPFEHCAKVMTQDEIINKSDKKYLGANISTLGWSGNYRGFIQYRKMFQGENKKDKRVLSN